MFPPRQLHLTSSPYGTLGPHQRQRRGGRLTSSQEPRWAGLSGLRRWALASLIGNIGIVVTGGAVRLTGSGLGCPAWPRCTEDSFVPTGEAGIHEAIEFGNRLVTFVLVAIAVGTLVSAWRQRPVSPRLRRPALILALGIPAQAVVGGLSVLSGLNPWVVSAHFLLSMGLVTVAVLLLRRTHVSAGSRARRSPETALFRTLSAAVAAAAVVVVWLGTVTTASGPHAGDAGAPRTGLNLQLTAQVHADAVFLLVGLTIATVVVTRAAHAPARLRRAADVLLAVELAQGVVGYGQWFAGLPPALVAIHMLGACVVVAAVTDLWLAARPERTTTVAGAAVATLSPGEQVPQRG